MDEYQIIPLPLPNMETLETRAVLKNCRQPIDT